MTNPNNAIGTNGAYDGRTSVNAFNDVLQSLTPGVLSGWTCSPKTGMTVQLGGDGATRDVAIAQDNAGNRTTIDNISGQPVEITLDAAPATGSRIDCIVAYVENPPQGDPAQVDNFAACGFIAVPGTAANSPVAPTDGIIRTAITSDGATGATAYYVILAQVLVGTNVTTIGSGVITQGTQSAVVSSKIDWTTFEEVTVSQYFKSGSYLPTSANFKAVRFGKIMFVMRCGITGLPSTGTTAVAGTVREEYLPAVGSNIRIMFSAGAAGTTTNVGQLGAPDGDLTVGKASGGTTAWACGFAYYLA